MTTFEGRVSALLARLTYKPNYSINLHKDAVSGHRLYLQVQCWRKDSTTGAYDWGHGGKGYLSEHMTDGEILRLALGLHLAYEEHECREFFKWNGRALFGPHISAEKLWEIANDLEVRDDLPCNEKAEENWASWQAKHAALRGRIEALATQAFEELLTQATEGKEPSQFERNIHTELRALIKENK